MRAILSLTMSAVAGSIASLLLSTAVIAGEDSMPKPKPALPSCEGELHHQFDFWIGDWVVTNGDKQLGENRIHPVENGCAINEHWTGAGGGTGVSYSAYDRNDGKWHQFWVSGTGMVLHLVGGLVDGAMVLHGKMPNPTSGDMDPQRVTWTPNADGSIRQHWEAKPDGGDWLTVFDGLYRKRSASDG